MSIREGVEGFVRYVSDWVLILAATPEDLSKRWWILARKTPLRWRQSDWAVIILFG